MADCHDTVAMAVLAREHKDPKTRLFWYPKKYLRIRFVRQYYIEFQPSSRQFLLQPLKNSVAADCHDTVAMAVLAREHIKQKTRIFCYPESAIKIDL